MKFSVKIAGIFAVVAFALTAVSANAAFTRDLTMGSTGPDVTELQNILIKAGYSIPAGATGYFGAQTQAAVSAWQKAVGISPAAGYFGPISKAKLAAAPSTPGDDNDSDNGSGDLGSGEASLEAFDISSGDDSDVKEDDSAEVAEIEFDVEDGDISLDRVDLAITSDTSTEDPWDVFEEVRLLVDGDEIASKNLSDEDEYLDEDAGTFRLSGIDFIAKDGDTVKIVVEVTTQNNVDNDAFDAWNINVLSEGIRATDGEGIQQYIGDTEEVSFDVVEAGDDDSLDVNTSSDDPNATTLKVEDNSKSELYSIFAFDLESGDMDIDIDKVTLTATGSVALSNLVDDYILEIDGQEFDDWSYVSGASASTTREIEFDINNDFTLDADSEVTVVLMAKFKANATGTISAAIYEDSVEGEGGDDILSDGEAEGETHTLSLAGVIIDADGFSFTKATQGDNDTIGVFELEFEVEAFEEDFYITDNAALASTTPTNGVEFLVEGGTATTVTSTLSSTGDEDSAGVFTIKKGTSETFTLTVTVDAASAAQFRVVLNSVWSSQTNTGLSGVEKTLEETDFRTTYLNIN